MSRLLLWVTVILGCLFTWAVVIHFVREILK